MNNRRSLILGARQIGKSFLISYVAICLALGIKYRGKEIPASDVSIISRSQDASNNIIREIQKHLSLLKIVAPVEHDVLGSQSTVILSNGKRIKSFSSSVLSVQGSQGVILIDEFATNQNSHEELFAQSLSVTRSRNYYKTIILTNAGERSSFLDNFINSESDIWKKRRRGWYINTTNIYDIYKNGLDEEMQSIKDSLSANIWKRDYLCQFADADSQALDEKLIYESIENNINIKGQIAIGIDFGLVSNPTVVTIAELGGNKVKIIDQLIWFEKHSEDQIKEIVDLVNKYKPFKIICDGNGIGKPIFQILERKLGRIIESISFNQKNRQSWFQIFERLLIEKRIQLINNQFLIDDLIGLSLDEFGLIEIPKRKYKNWEIHSDAYESLSCILPLASLREERSDKVDRERENFRSVLGHMGKTNRFGI